VSNGKAARLKGIRWERALASYFGTITTRSTRPGVHDDGGDVILPGWVVEAKDHGRWTVQAWFELTERKCRPGERPVLVLKRRQKPTGDALVVLRLSDWWSPEDDEVAS
jgi:hypothetical protein